MMTNEPKFSMVAHDAGDMRYLTIKGFGYMSSYKCRPAVVYTESRVALKADELFALASIAKHFNRYWSHLMDDTDMQVGDAATQSPAEIRHNEDNQ